MLKYNDLTKAQKRWVDAVIEVRPALAKGGTITLKECAAVYDELRSTRKSGGEKIGYPNWLYASNKTARGQYEFPAPNGVSTKAKAKNDKTKLEQIIAESEIETEQSDADFLKELRDNGIAV